MALAQHPTRVDSRNLLGAGLNPGDLDPADVGITTNPTGYLSPNFTIGVVNTGGGWNATVTITQNAHEGANVSRYLTAGLYSTGLMAVHGGFLGPFIAGPNNRQIYVEISNTIANLNRQAEQEHCDDIIRARDLTLRAMQIALTNAVAGNPHAGGTQVAAVTAARDAITNGLHARLQTIVNNAVDVNNATVNQAGFSTAMRDIYLELCGQSGAGRDGPGRHTFRPAGTESWSAWSWTEWAGRKVLPNFGHSLLFGDKKDIRELRTGATFLVPGPATNVLINL